jgi:hypothetical protein
LHSNGLLRFWIAAILPLVLGIGASSGYAQISKPYVEESLAQHSLYIPCAIFLDCEIIFRK